MLGRLFTLASALSLLLCIAMMALWARSDEGRDEIQFQWRGAAYALASERGRIGIDNQPQLRQFSQARQKAEQDVRDAQMAYHGESENDPYLAALVQASNRFFALTGHGPPTLIRHVIPYWAIIVGAWVLPASWAWRWQRRRLRIAAHRCAECGYDLRASEGRCPECGSPIPQKAEPNA